MEQMTSFEEETGRILMFGSAREPRTPEEEQESQELKEAIWRFPCPSDDSGVRAFTEAMVSGVPVEKAAGRRCRAWPWCSRRATRTVCASVRCADGVGWDRVGMRHTSLTIDVRCRPPSPDRSST